jgi:predicted amidohydrolase
MDVMKAGYVQFAPVLGDLNATISRLDQLIGSPPDADILVLPELCNSGYNFASYDDAWACSESVSESVFIEYLESIAVKLGGYIVSGFNERSGDALYNSAVLIGPNGYVGTYRKLHLFFKEKKIFAPGDKGLPVFDVEGCKMGMLICFDWLFPEVWRILALNGADLICHPSNLILPNWAQQAIPVHALINRVYIVLANRIGAEGKLSFTGLSMIAGPRGEILQQASGTDENVGVAEVDPSRARDKMITPFNHVLADRRPDVYSALGIT